MQHQECGFAGGRLVKPFLRDLALGARPPQAGKPRSHTVLRENAILKNELSAAKAYIAGLEQELATALSATSCAHRQDVDTTTRTKIQKVAELWLRGGTDGERCAAIDRLWTIARRLGWDLHNLLRECAVESPVHFTEGTAG